MLDVKWDSFHWSWIVITWFRSPRSTFFLNNLNQKYPKTDFLGLPVSQLSLLARISDDFIVYGIFVTVFGLRCCVLSRMPEHRLSAICRRFSVVWCDSDDGSVVLLSRDIQSREQKFSTSSSDQTLWSKLSSPTRFLLPRTDSDSSAVLESAQGLDDGFWFGSVAQRRAAGTGLISVFVWSQFSLQPIRLKREAVARDAWGQYLVISEPEAFYRARNTKCFPGSVPEEAGILSRSLYRGMFTRPDSHPLIQRD
jgi:hypothetical protein